MGADDWRYEYLSNELRDNKKRLEDAEKQVTEAQSELNAAEWQRDKYKTIVAMLEVAYKVNVTNRIPSNTSCAHTVGSEEKMSDLQLIISISKTEIEQLSKGQKVTFDGLFIGGSLPMDIVLIPNKEEKK